MARQRAFKEDSTNNAPSAAEFKAQQAAAKASDKPALDPTTWPLPPVGEKVITPVAEPAPVVTMTVAAAPAPVVTAPAATGSAAELVVADFKAAVQAIDGMELKAALNLIEARIAIVRAIHGI